MGRARECTSRRCGPRQVSPRACDPILTRVRTSGRMRGILEKGRDRDPSAMLSARGCQVCVRVLDEIRRELRIDRRGPARVR